jgi:hypothetical protein
MPSIPLAPSAAGHRHPDMGARSVPPPTRKCSILNQTPPDGASQILSTKCVSRQRPKANRTGQSGERRRGGLCPSCHDRAGEHASEGRPHSRARSPGHPRLCLDRRKKSWVPGPNPAMTQGLNPAMTQGLNPAMTQGLNPAMTQGLNPAMTQRRNPSPDSPGKSQPSRRVTMSQAPPRKVRPCPACPSSRPHRPAGYPYE